MGRRSSHHDNPCAPPPSPSRSALLLSALASAALADRASLDCPLRQLQLDFAQQIQPNRALSVFQALADALNGAQEAQNCSVAPRAGLARAGARRVAEVALPAAGLVLFADARRGCDERGDGSAALPFSSPHRALAAVRAARAGRAAAELSEGDRATIVLREGTFFLGARGPLELGPRDSFVTLQAYPGEDVVVSGGVPIDGVTWAPVAPPARSLYEYRSGALAAGFDCAPPQTMTVAAAQAACSAMAVCAGISYNDPSPSPSGPVLVSFKYETFWSKQSGASTYVRNAGYEAGAANLYQADVSLLNLASSIDALRVNGQRAVRARYPNVKSVEQVGAMQIDALAWTPQSAIGMNKLADYTYILPNYTRSDSAQGYFQQGKIGVGGDCARRFTPQASYWCSNSSQGGGPGPYSAPVGMTMSNDGTSLPHTPYSSPSAGRTALVHSWRAGRWFSWVFQSDSLSFDAATNKTTFNFSLAVGGNQGSRGGDAGQEVFIENVLDELDAPGEFFYDADAKQLYLWHNASGGTPPPSQGAVVAAMLPVLVNATGTQAEPVVGVGFLGLTFSDSAPNYLGPHGTVCIDALKEPALLSHSHPRFHPRCLCYRNRNCSHLVATGPLAARPRSSSRARWARPSAAACSRVSTATPSSSAASRATRAWRTTSSSASARRRSRSGATRTARPCRAWDSTRRPATSRAARRSCATSCTRSASTRSRTPSTSKASRSATRLTRTSPTTGLGRGSTSTTAWAGARP